MIIGLTGTYCAGKNHVAAIFEKRGFPSIDVDKLGYQVLEVEKDAICAKFGSDLQALLEAQNRENSAWFSKSKLHPLSGEDRRLLGQIVFSAPEKLAALEAIVHPATNRLTEEWITEKEKSGAKACIINAALLHRSSVFDRLERIILVTAPYLIRLYRARRRDRLPWQEIVERFNNQKDFNTQYLSGKAEIYRVGNSGCPIIGNLILKKQIDKFINNFIEGTV